MRRELAAWQAWQKRMRVEEVYTALRRKERLSTKNNSFPIFDVEKGEYGIFLRLCCVGGRGYTIVLYIYILAGVDGLIGGTEFLTASFPNGLRLANDPSIPILYQSLLNFGEGLGLLTQDELTLDSGNYVGC